MLLADAIFNAVFLGFFFFGGVTALILGLTAPAHNSALAAVSGLASGGGAFSAVAIAGPFFEALDDLWWAMGYSSGMLFTGRCKDSTWNDEQALPKWADLLRARDLAGAVFRRAYLPGPGWLCLVLGYGALALTIITMIATIVLVFFPHDANVRTAASAGNIATFCWVLLYLILLLVHRYRFKHGWKKDPELLRDASEAIERLGGWESLGSRISLSCAGAARFAPFMPGAGTLVAGMLVSSSVTVMVKLWPYRHFLAFSAGAAVLLAALAILLGGHIRVIHHALRPETVSPCRSLPLVLLLHDAAKRRDCGAPLVWRRRKDIQTK